MALRDAAALRDALATVERGEQELLPTLAAYEREMIDYGAAVRASLEEMNRLHTTSAIRRFATKTLFRLVDAVPPPQRLFRGKR
jgi:2-polyprenyl-6-methoxyphenol hydroxylase-like FAD-dependent oxidoreductase